MVEIYRLATQSSENRCQSPHSYWLFVPVL